jgi:hypothetical protein
MGDLLLVLILLLGAGTVDVGCIVDVSEDHTAFMIWVAVRNV